MVVCMDEPLTFDVPDAGVLPVDTGRGQLKPRDVEHELKDWRCDTQMAF